MAADEEVTPMRARTAPEVVAPTNKVNVALPFSHLVRRGTEPGPG
jgi:hypothetical protein